MQRDLLLGEKTAWRNYKGYVLFQRMGNRGYGSQETFLGDDYSRELWRQWIERRRQVLVERKRRR